MDLANFGGEQLAGPCEPSTQMQYKQLRNPNVTERLEMQIADAEERLGRLKAAHDELKKYPDIERLLNLLQRV